MTVKVTSKLADGLVDGFTGKPLEVVMTVAKGVAPLYSCPDAFSVHTPRKTLVELQDDVSMKEGVCGLRDAIHPTDPYTGEAFKLRTFPDGRFSYQGGLNPRKAFQSLEELRYWFSMRAGVSPFPKPGSSVKAEKPERKERELPEVGAPSDVTKETVEKVIAAHMPRGTSVSMSVTKKSTKKTRK